MVKEKDTNTESSILEAARKVFTRKGYEGARMEDIAKEAGINRALLHYYFRNKARMFEVVFEQRFREFFSGLMEILHSDLELEEKIKAIIDHDIIMISKHPDLPLFILQEVNQNPERLKSFIQKLGATPGSILDGFNKQVAEEVKKGTIRKITGIQLMMNILSLCIYPFIARPMIQFMNGLTNDGFDKLMESRKEEVIAFVLQGIQPAA